MKSSNNNTLQPVNTAKHLQYAGPYIRSNNKTSKQTTNPTKQKSKGLTLKLQREPPTKTPQRRSRASHRWPSICMMGQASSKLSPRLTSSPALSAGLCCFFKSKKRYYHFRRFKCHIHSYSFIILYLILINLIILKF